MDSEPCSLSALIDGGQPWRRYLSLPVISITIFCIRSYGNNIVYTDWQRDNYFVAVKEALGDAKGRIGVEFDHLTLDSQGWVHFTIC